jgi:hypothetical protein
MSLPEFITPMLSIAGPAALVFVILRCFPLVARAVVVLLAGIAAIVTADKDRRAASIKVLDALGHPPRSDQAKPPGDAVDQQDGTRRADR